MVEPFEQAFDKMFTSAYRLAHRVLGEHAAAEDVAAEACARAYASWRRVGELSYREAWVLRVAANLAIDLVRRKPRYANSSHRTDMEDVIALRITLAAALKKLPRRQREAVVLRHLGGLPEADVAELLGISSGSVKTHLSRGLAALRTRLGDEFGEAYLV